MNRPAPAPLAPSASPSRSPITLSDLLARRTLRPGEAVTVLVPLLQTLDDLHALDCTHGHVSPESVVFDPTGRPTFSDWQACTEHRRGAIRAPTFRPAMIEDYRGFVSLARSVLARTDGSPSSPDRSRRGRGGDAAWLPATFLAAELARLERGRREPFVRECEAALFALAPPLPVGLIPPGDVAAPPPMAASADDYDWSAQTAAVLATVDDDVAEMTRSDLEERRPGARVRSLIVGVRRGLRARAAAIVGWSTGRDGTGERGGGDADQRSDGTGGSVGGGRTRRVVRPRTVIVAAVVCGCAVAGAMFAIPPSTDSPTTTDQTGDLAPDQTTRTGPAPGSTLTGPPRTGTTGTDVSRPASATSTPPGPNLGESPAIRGEDPVAAGVALLAARDECLSGVSVGCLDAVDQPSSAALSVDRITVAANTGMVPAAAEGGAVPSATVRTVSLRLVQAVGVSALLEILPNAVEDGAPGGAAAGGASVSGAGADRTAASGAGGSASGVGAEREPASLLLVKGEAGWRIRELFE